MDDLNRRKIREIVNRMAPADLELYYAWGDAAGFWRNVREHEAYRSNLEEIRSEGERLLKEELPELGYALFSIFRATGSRLEYERVYFERRRRLNTFTLLCLLEPDSKLYASHLHETIWSICREYTWCLPAHLGVDDDPVQSIDLFSAETAFTLAEISLLLGERLPQRLRCLIESEVNRRILRPFLVCGPFFWETASHNWSAVCAGSIGATGLLLEQSPEALTDLLLRVQASLEWYLRGFGGDGACLEGLGYWNYGFGYFVYYADLLRSRTDGELDWFTRGKVRQIALFQQKCYLGGRAVANFSDSLPTHPVHVGLSHKLAEFYPEFELPPADMRADYRDDHCSRWAPALRNLIWRNPAVFEGKREWGTAACFLPDAQWLISRYRSVAGMFGFAAKGGHNGEPHNHNDLGHFMLLADGMALVADLGCGEYTADYFGAGRYEYACNGSQGHAVPVIDGHGQEAGEDRAAAVLEDSTGETADLLRLELAGAYPPAVAPKSYIRSFVWHKSELPVLKLEDVFRFFKPPGSLSERVVTLAPPVIDQVQGVIILSPAKEGAEAAYARRLRIKYDPSVLKASVEEQSYRDHFGRDRVWYALDFHVEHLLDEIQVILWFEFM
ncbi:MULTISPECIES: heparinase II/III family protein [Paenibacillus]|uniref:heparinase II/III family protein n=1 Tax=Paenibacillus TaxID=44249 RepID=UPI002FE0E55C